MLLAICVGVAASALQHVGVLSLSSLCTPHQTPFSHPHQLSGAEGLLSGGGGVTTASPEPDSAMASPGNRKGLGATIPACRHVFGDGLLSTVNSTVTNLFVLLVTTLALCRLFRKRDPPRRGREKPQHLASPRCLGSAPVRGAWGWGLGHVCQEQVPY